VTGPRVVLAAHGSPHAAHGRAVLALRDAVAATRPGAVVTVGWLGFASPTVTEAAVHAATRSRDGWVSVVPLLLTDGYHAQHDIPAALASVPRAVQQPVLGPDPLLADALVRRLRERGARPQDRVVLAAAGSSDASARLQCEQAADLLAARLGDRVPTGYATGPGPSVAEAVAQAAADRAPRGGGVLVATYLLGPGALADKVAAQARAAGAVASAPLGTAPELVELIARRWLAPALAPAA
jgi:sirohydrochlorin ferrochelatase